MTHFLHKIEITLSVDCITEDSLLTAEEAERFIHDCDPSLWKNKISFDDYEFKVSNSVPCTLDGTEINPRKGGDEKDDI